MDENLRNAIIVLALNHFIETLTEILSQEPDNDTASAMKLLAEKIITEFPIDNQKPQWEKLNT